METVDTMNSYHILLVDDELRLTQCLELVLSMEGYTVTTANSGEEALQELEQLHNNGSKVDLLVTDILMPGMSGLELITELDQRDIRPFTIGISGFTDDYAVSELRYKGCGDLMLKPFTPVDLLNKISETLTANNKEQNIA
jgi:CheY-like chemotaxis protein